MQPSITTAFVRTYELREAPMQGLVHSRLGEDARIMLPHYPILTIPATRTFFALNKKQASHLLSGV